MTSPTSQDRTTRARAAITAYRILGHTGFSCDEALIDLLTDLMHWAKHTGLDFQQALDHAQFHFDAEVQP